MVVQRGDVWWLSLSEAVGATPAYRRPVVVVQDDAFNRSQIHTLIVVLLTSNLRLADAPGNVFLPSSTTGLPRDSVANVSQLVTVDRVFLTDFSGRLPSSTLSQIDTGLRLVLSL